MRLREMPHCDRQAAHMIVMAMRNRNRIHLFIADHAKHGESLASLAFGMNPGVHQEPMSFQIDEPGGRADVSIGVQIDDAHQTKWGGPVRRTIG